MPNTIWVQALTRDRKVILSEASELHPTSNHEIWLVGYEEPRFDADGIEITPANPPTLVGDTPGVRRAISDQLLAIVDAPATRQQAGRETAQERKDRLAAEQKAEADRLAAEKAAQGGQT